jgi:diguanylate cyclase (GGDEF)-like protein
MQPTSMLVVLCAMNILTLLALVSERCEAEWALSLANRTLEVRVAERTAQLRHQAETNALTGQPPRFHRAGGVLAGHNAWLRRAFGLIAFDLDHFKPINDSAGHAGGDEVLRLVASRCRAQLRADDLFGRLGGEEFAVALPGQDYAAAGAVAERLRIALHEVRPGFPLPDGRLAASFGVAIRRLGEGLSTLLLSADDALYEAKHNGRDQVRLAEPAASPRHAAAG